MTAYLIIKFDIVDEPDFDIYATKVMPLIAKHQGRILVSDKAGRALEGPEPGMNVVIEFPSQGLAEAFYDDPEYQPVKQIRLSATTNRSAVLSPAFQS